MAKQRKKRKNRRKVSTLSKFENFAYIFLMIISLIIVIGLLFYGMMLNKELAFNDENTVLFADRWTLLLILPLFLFVLIFIVGYLDEAKSNGRHLFKKKQKKKLDKNEKKYRIISYSAITIVGVISVLFAIGGIFGRTCLLNNGHIQVYSIANNVKNEYSLGDYSKITIEYGRESVGKHDWRPACYFNIETDSGKEFDFCMNDSRFLVSDIDKNLQNMLSVKECYEKQGIDVSVDGEDKLEELIEYYEMNDREKEMLYELFEIK